MNFVTYNNIRLICYLKFVLNFVLMAPQEVAGSPILARAIDNFKLILLGKKEKSYNFNFLIQTLFLSSSTTHTRLSPFDNPNCSTISLGIVVRKLFDWALA